jgi:hypothetical protein
MGTQLFQKSCSTMSYLFSPIHPQPKHILPDSRPLLTLPGPKHHPSTSPRIPCPLRRSHSQGRRGLWKPLSIRTLEQPICRPSRCARPTYHQGRIRREYIAWTEEQCHFVKNVKNANTLCRALSAQGHQVLDLRNHQRYDCQRYDEQRHY